jgi:hypothetical protein
MTARHVDPVDDLMEGNGKRALAALAIRYRQALQQIARQSPWTPSDWPDIGRESVNIATRALHEPAARYTVSKGLTDGRHGAAGWFVWDTIEGRPCGDFDREQDALDRADQLNEGSA